MRRVYRRTSWRDVARLLAVAWRWQLNNPADSRSTRHLAVHTPAHAVASPWPPWPWLFTDESPMKRDNWHGVYTLQPVVQPVVQPVGWTMQMRPAKRRWSGPARTFMTSLRHSKAAVWTVDDVARSTEMNIQNISCSRLYNRSKGVHTLWHSGVEPRSANECRISAQTSAPVLPNPNPTNPNP